MSTRYYSYTCYRHGGQAEVMNRLASSRARLRTVSILLFRAWFGGRSPDRLCWHIDGQMAGCKDRRGNSIFVEQLNSGDATFEALRSEESRRERKRWWLAIAPAQGRAAA